MKSRLLLILLLFAVPATILCGQAGNKKITITGVITDVNQKPVAGATILVDNKNTNKVTNNKGAFKVKVKSDAKKISVMSVSGAVAESEINGKTKINFSLPIDVLKEANIQKDDKNEEDINVGYGKVKRKNLVTPVGKVNDTNHRFADYQNIYDVLRGQPGVQVNGTSIKIQGASSLMSGTDPLLVVDGIPVSSIDGIQPYTIKSIEILKGSAASIYGVRGANGVILITLIGSSGVK
jgi:TonB-dependent SusC/RagA subfamily outer membrane receptor